MNNVFHPIKMGTILIPSGPSKHLHFICSDPVFYPALVKECVLVVNISTIDALLDYDKSCILQRSDHPFIKHPSYVYYRKADIFGADSISRNVAEGNFTLHVPCSEATFERIFGGFNISDEVRPKIKKFYQRYCL